MDRRHFLRGTMGAAFLASRSADSTCAAWKPADAPGLGSRASTPSTADSQRHEDADQGILREAARRYTIAADRCFHVSGPDERHRRYILAVLRHRASTQPKVFSIVDCLQFQATMPALGPINISRPRHAARRFSCSVLYLRRWLRHRRPWVFAHGHSQPDHAPSAVVSAASNGREWRSRLLGFAFTQNSARP